MDFQIFILSGTYVHLYLHIPKQYETIVMSFSRLYVQKPYYKNVLKFVTPPPPLPPSPSRVVSPLHFTVLVVSCYKAYIISGNCYTYWSINQSTSAGRGEVDWTFAAELRFLVPQKMPFSKEKTNFNPGPTLAKKLIF